MKQENVILTEQQIKDWKSKWGKIYKTTIDEEFYIWRKLRRKEYVEIISDIADEGEENKKYYQRQDEITKTIVLYPENIEQSIEENAGLASVIAGEALEKSGFNLSQTEEI